MNDEPDEPDILDKIKVGHDEPKPEDMSNHPLRFLDDYFPDHDNMKLKGRLKAPLTVRFSAIDAIFFFYPEISHLEDIVKNWADAIEQRLVSVDGLSREEYKEILIALLHGYKMEEDTNSDKQSFFKQIFDAGGEKTDD